MVILILLMVSGVLWTLMSPLFALGEGILKWFL